LFLSVKVLAVKRFVGADHDVISRIFVPIVILSDSFPFFRRAVESYNFKLFAIIENIKLNIFDIVTELYLLELEAL
jgi:hypothetical protein